MSCIRCNTSVDLPTANHVNYPARVAAAAAASDPEFRRRWRNTRAFCGLVLLSQSSDFTLVSSHLVALVSAAQCMASRDTAADDTRRLLPIHMFVFTCTCRSDTGELTC